MNDITQQSSAAGPEFRVWLCGAFHVEKRVGERYELIHTADWGGSNYPRLLLKALLCCPGRQARRDTLLDLLWPEADFEQATVYLNTATTKLRRLLRPANGQDSFLFTENDAAFYRLAGQTLLWVDAEEGVTLFQEAERRGRTSPEALPLLEQAATSFNRGSFLQDEEGVWAAGRRASVEQVRASCRLWLAEAYTHHGLPGQAVTVLQALLEEDPLDEDVLGRLMDLLHQQGMTHQALRLYEQSCQMLAREELEPSEATRELAARLRKERHFSSLVSADSAQIVLNQGALSIISQSVSGLEERSLSIFPSTNLTSLLSLESAPEDSAAWLGIRLAYLLNVIHQWKPGAMSCDILQAIVDREIAMFDDLPETPQREAFLLSRRQALITLASLPVMLTAPLQAPLLHEEFLPQCAASITACWHLLRGREFLLIEKLLTHYLSILADMAHQTSFPYRINAAQLATQGYRLMGILSLHQGRALARTAYFEQAIHFAEIAETPNLLAAALISQAYHEADPKKAAILYQRGTEQQNPLSPLVLARLYARLAVVSAQQAQETDALRYLQQAQEIYPQAPETDPCFLYAEFCPSSLTMEVGLTYLVLAQQTSPRTYAQQARKSFAGVDSVRTPIPTPVRIRYEIINHEARTSLILNDLEEFCSLLEKGMNGARLLQSNQRKREVLQLYKDARIQWPEETRVRALADLVL